MGTQETDPREERSKVLAAFLVGWLSLALTYVLFAIVSAYILIRVMGKLFGE